MASTRPRRAYWRRDILWVYHNLDEQGVKKADAPTTAAWGLLTWARANRDKYYDKYLSRIVEKDESKKAEQAAEQVDARDDKLIRELKGYLQQLKRTAGVG